MKISGPRSSPPSSPSTPKPARPASDGVVRINAGPFSHGHGVSGKVAKAGSSYSDNCQLASYHPKDGFEKPDLGGIRSRNVKPGEGYSDNCMKAGHGHNEKGVKPPSTQTSFLDRLLQGLHLKPAPGVGSGLAPTGPQKEGGKAGNLRIGLGHADNISKGDHWDLGPDKDGTARPAQSGSLLRRLLPRKPWLTGLFRRRSHAPAPMGRPTMFGSSHTNNVAMSVRAPSVKLDGRSE